MCAARDYLGVTMVIWTVVSTSCHGSDDPALMRVTQDPLITIEVIHHNYSSRDDDTILLIATCNVTASDGKPQMSLQCNGESSHEILSQELEWYHASDHVNGSLTVAIHTKECVQINCTVTDARGSYSATKNIALYGAPEHTSMGTGLKAGLICLGIVIWALLGVTSVICLARRRAKNLQKRLDARDYPMETDSNILPPESISDGYDEDATQDFQSLTSNGTDSLNQNPMN